MAKIRHELRIRLAALTLGLPPLIAAIALLWLGPYSAEMRWSISVTLTLLWLWALADLHHRIVYPLRTVSNMLAALRERDFSMRVRGVQSDDALGDVLFEINGLADLLREQRLSAVETSALLRRIMAQIDVAVLAFDQNSRLKLLNVQAERLIKQSAEHPIGKGASELGLASLLSGPTPRMLDTSFAGQSGRWELRRGTFLEGGAEHQLVVLSDLTRALREEERQAWQRLVHVLRHEVNNSLAPICSVAESLATLLARKDANGSADDLREGLAIISNRSRSLTRFMTAYSQLTRLPPPKASVFEIRACLQGVVALETRVRVTIASDAPMQICADRDQVEQLVLNLLRNAAEAAMETCGDITVGWGHAPGDSTQCEIWIEDNGPGISNPDNLFVPFYTTKPNGSGIGLALCRQIAEAHGGTVTLVPRVGTTGCRATCRLPIKAPVSGQSNVTSEHYRVG
jgi:nitrogen fixation/metabolism regulation signal transduction histidine kinase